MKWASVILLLFTAETIFCGHNIHKHFMDWMKKNLRPDEVKAIVRDDLTTGSFGGGKIGRSDSRPVVLIHGLNNEAGNLWKIRRDMVAAGFPTQHLFATTWGKGLESFNMNVKMTCDHVKHIRRFIQIVQWYTGSEQIDVIGYSMGSPMARKAILGGKCVDSDYNLGPPMTSKIHTFISVAGANQGSQLCVLPIFEICNAKNGLTCSSEFLKDINAASGYEATHKKFNLASTGDMMVGYHSCGKKASHYTGAQEWKISGKYHEETEFDTAAIQLQMLRDSATGTSKRRVIGLSSKKKKNAFIDVKTYLKSSRFARHSAGKSR